MRSLFRYWLVLGSFCALSAWTFGASAPRLEVHPSSLTFESRRAGRQLVVTAYVDGEARDVTHLAEYSTSNRFVAQIEHAYASAAGNGTALITVKWNGQSLQVPVEVLHYTSPDPIQFKFETMPILTKQGCATGSCHGSPQGKAGFSLSLFGYDPNIDRRSLIRDGFSRRVDVVEPEESLMLRKPLLEVDHVGGKRLRRNEVPYQTLLEWISEGANVDLPAVECERIAVYPGPDRVLKTPYLTQQLSVLAYYSDGSVRDVTEIATYDTSNPDISVVDARGRVTGKRRGQVAISVRYLSQLQSVYFTTIEDIPDFAWKAPTEVNFVDHLVNEKLHQLQYLPAETCDDATFMRRIYLDLTGLVPTAAEARAFIGDQAANKRARLIDQLLGGEAFARFWALKEADLMRVSKTRLKDGRAEAFSDWLIAAQRKDMPYDEFARRLLTAKGDTRTVPEANFFLAIPGPQERTEMTAQLFLGSRLECTKCHNHPYEKWTMKDYYSLSAVFARTAVDQGVVQTVETGETIHPVTKQVMQPWGSTQGDTDGDRRVPFVAWLTEPGNPFFARVEVNRIWAHLFGRGIVDPVDDFRSSNPPANVPLLDALAQEFVKEGYHRKAIIRLICNSQTYQRSLETTAFNESDELLFSHARPRLLTAEQLKDAVGLAAGTLAPVEQLPAQIARNQAELSRRQQELEAGFSDWLERATADVAARDYWAGVWYAVGPFSSDSPEESRTEEFGPEQAPLNFAAAFDHGQRHWRSHPEWSDPAVLYTVDCPKDAVVYLGREIFSREARTLQVTARGAAMIWCNGRPVLTQGLNNERRVPIELSPGRNQIVMKLRSRTDDAQFRFRPEEPKPAEGAAPVARMPLPPEAIALLANPAQERTTEELQRIHDLYPQTDESYRAIEGRLAGQQQHLDYATQRPYPEAMPFMVAFGQPKRETACSCERVSAPTLLQALELLNGSMMQQAVKAGSERYARMDEGQLIEELYLSALARFPTPGEQATARRFLAQADNRNDAVMDLLWSVLNTREFLFQH